LFGLFEIDRLEHGREARSKIRSAQRAARLFDARMTACARDVQIDPEAATWRRIFVLSVAVHERGKALRHRFQEGRLGLGLIRTSANVKANIIDLELGQRS